MVAETAVRPEIAARDLRAMNACAQGSADGGTADIQERKRHRISRISKIIFKNYKLAYTEFQIIDYFCAIS